MSTEPSGLLETGREWGGRGDYIVIPIATLSPPE